MPFTKMIRCNKNQPLMRPIPLMHTNKVSISLLNRLSVCTTEHRQDECRFDVRSRRNPRSAFAPLAATTTRDPKHANDCNKSTTSVLLPADGGYEISSVTGAITAASDDFILAVPGRRRRHCCRVMDSSNAKRTNKPFLTPSSQRRNHVDLNFATCDFITASS